MRNTLCAALFVLVLAPATAGCSGAAQQHQTLNAITAVADPVYGDVVDLCDDLRDRVIARAGTTEAEDRASMDEIAAVCDPTVAGFEALRGSQLTARQFIDSGVGSAAATAVAEALRLWPQVQALVVRIAGAGGS